MRRTWKKTISAFLALSMLSFTGCSLLGEPSEDDDGGTEPLIPVLPVPEAPEEEVIVLPETLDFTPKGIEKQYGYVNFYNMQKEEKTYCYFYQDLYNACLALTDDKTITPITQNAQDATGAIKETEFYIVQSLDYVKYGLTVDEALAIWKTLRMDYPEFYWIDNQVSYVQGGKVLNLQIVPEYASGSVRTQLQKAIEAKANDCFSYLSADMTATEMALTIYDYVIASLYYAYKTDETGAEIVDSETGNKIPEDAVWAHNLIGLAEKGTGVCETYAKSFEYLCSLIGIEAITVDGIAGQTEDESGGHAWNVVKIDGVWYCVDATWGDQPTLYRDWFGVGVTEFNETHEADEAGETLNKDWQYELPTLSQKSLSPVRMQVGDETGKMYGCIDYAFADILDESKDYTIKLLPDTTVTAEKSTKIHLSQVSFETGALPKANMITFVGDRDGMTPVSMLAKNAVALASDINLQDIAWTYPSLTKNGYTVSKSHFSFHGVGK